MKNQVKNLELGREYPAPDEEAAIQEIIDMHVTSFLDRTRHPVQRAQHPKHHGCVRAEFTVLADLPESLRVGVFSQPRTFPAWIRFSNSREQDDRKFDGRGMAVKLMDVPGKKILEDEQHTQDFVMINHPRFFIRDLSDYVVFFKALQKATFPLEFFIPSLNPWQWRLRELWISVLTISQKISNPLGCQYWSTTPYKLGSQAIKFSAKPEVLLAPGLPWNTSENYLRTAMMDTLREQPVTFHFLVQVQTDPVQMPIEDPTQLWTAPWIKVATIHIPVQTFDTETQMTFCENLSYTPWHTLPEHQPLGGINRARLRTYQTLSNLRHELNHRLPQEPVPTGSEA